MSNKYQSDEDRLVTGYARENHSHPDKNTIGNGNGLDTRTYLDKKTAITLIDFLEFHAKLKPGAPAIFSRDESISYADLINQVRQAACKLRNFGIEAGSLVVTRIDDVYLNLVINLALLHECTISCSTHDYASLPPELCPNFYISEKFDGNLDKDRQYILSDEFFDEFVYIESGFNQIRYADENAICSLILSSGTTGTSKAIPQSSKNILDRVHGRSVYFPTNGCHYSLMTPASAGGFISYASPLISGQPLCVENDVSKIPKLIEKYQIKYISGSPAQFAALTHLYQHANEKQHPCVKAVLIMGGTTSPKVLKNIDAFLTKNIIILYGSSETAGTCFYNASNTLETHTAAGQVFPGNQVQIVDDEDNTLAQGISGKIRIQTPFMCHHYYNNEKATRDNFKDGWFYPGDLGFFDENETLHLNGRTEEVINCGGVKINPEIIDNFICELDGIDDAATFGLENNLGATEIMAVVVCAEELNLQKIQAICIQKLGLAKSPKVFFRVRSIPRSNMGKVFRHVISQKLQSIIEFRNN